MRDIRLALTAIAALAAPSVASAQVGGGDPGAGIPFRQDIRPMGFQQGRYKSGFEYTAHFEADQCKAMGCIIVLNRSSNFDVTEFYINDGDVDSRGVPDWGENQFQGFHLDPRKAVWTVRPGKMKCETLVRVVMRSRTTREEREGIQVLDMCAMSRKGGFATLSVDGDDARVILEDGSTP